MSGNFHHVDGRYLQAQWAVKMNRILMTTNTRDTGLLPAQVPFTFTSAALVT